MYNNVAKFDNDYLAKANALPSNDTADGNGGSFHYAGVQASVEIVAVVNAAITIADTKVLTIKLQDSADDSTYADLTTLYTKTASGETVLAAGTELGRFILPTSTKEYVKAILTTTAATAGKVDIYPRYIAR